MVRTLPSNTQGEGPIPGQGVKIPRASWPENPNVKQKWYRNKFDRTLKMAHIKKKKSLKKNVLLKKKKSTVRHHLTSGRFER